MNDKTDWCEFFSNIEKDPQALVPRMTIGDLFRAREHLFSCDSCWLKSERVLSQRDNKDDIQFGEN